MYDELHCARCKGASRTVGIDNGMITTIHAPTNTKWWSINLLLIPDEAFFIKFFDSYVNWFSNCDNSHLS